MNALITNLLFSEWPIRTCWLKFNKFKTFRNRGVFPKQKVLRSSLFASFFCHDVADVSRSS